MKRNGKIEFLRFVFALIIIVHHSRFLMGDDVSLFLGGSLAVEFFFIVSGFLFANSVERKNEKGECKELGKETVDYLYRKIKVVFPEFFVSWIIGFVLISVLKQYDPKSSFKFFLDGLYELFLVHMSGLGKPSVNGVIWYVSTMLMSIAILYPVLRKGNGYHKYVLLPLIMILIYGYMFQNYDSPRNPTYWTGYTYKGNVRGFCDMIIGISTFYIYRAIKDIKLNARGSITAQILETAGYLIAIFYMYRYKASNRDYLVMVILAFSVLLSFLHKSSFSSFYDNKIVYFLGKFSTPMFFSHLYLSHYLNRILPYKEYYPMLGVYMLIAFANSFLIYYLSGLLRKVRWKEGLIRLFCENE